MSMDWRDGFLFVGNHLILDFLNTRPIMGAESVEMLPDCSALVRWLKAAGLLSSGETTRLARRWSSPEFAAAIEDLRQFREEVRRIVLQVEAGGSVPTRFIRDLNGLLLRHPAVDQVVSVDYGWARRRRSLLEVPQDAFAPLADAMADLLAKGDPKRIRKCGNCVLHFYDTSKKGTRLWCSMSLCGNRAKVAAYAERQRQAEAARGASKILNRSECRRSRPLPPRA